MTLALLLSTLLLSGFADDAPRGTDLLLRMDTGKLTKEVTSSREAISPLVSAWPPLRALSARVDSEWIWLFGTLKTRTGIDLARTSANVTLVADLDAAGGMIWALVIRNADGKSDLDVDTKDEVFEVDGHVARRLDKGDLAWSVVDKSTVVAGSVRGLQRQLRHLLAPTKNQEPLATEAARLRQSSPLQLAFALPDGIRTLLPQTLSHAGDLLAAATVGSIAARPGKISVRLTGEDEDAQVALEHSVKAFVALARASALLLQGGAETISGLRTLGLEPRQVPAEIDKELATTLSNSWVADFQLSAKVSKRRGHGIDATVDVSSYRGLLAAMGVMALMLAPGEATAPAEVKDILKELRRAQNAHKKAHGEYLRCGPIPTNLPAEPFEWPGDSCFNTIGFSPKGKVRYQLMADVEDGKLLLVARGDANQDGILEIWVLDNLTGSVRRWSGGGEP